MFDGVGYITPLCKRCSTISEVSPTDEWQDFDEFHLGVGT